MEQEKIPSTKPTLDALVTEVSAAVDAMPEYLHALESRYILTPEMRMMDQASEIISISQNGIDDPSPAAYMAMAGTAFRNGTIVGIHLAHTMLPDNLQGYLSSVLDHQTRTGLDGNIPEALVEKQRHFVDTLFDIGSDGYDENEEYHKLFEPIVRKLIPEVGTEVFARWGFGFVAKAFNEIYTNQDFFDLIDDKSLHQ